MQVHTTAPPPLLLLVGIAFIGGACALAWFSSLDVMTVTRTSPASVNVAFDDKLFGLVSIPGERIAGVRSARSVTAHPEGSTSRISTARFLAFDTANGQVFAEADRHYFQKYADDITAFIADPTRDTLVLRVSDDGSELFRFLFAQACVILLATVGGFVTWLGVRALLPDPNAGIGPV